MKYPSFSEWAENKYPEEYNEIFGTMGKKIGGTMRNMALAGSLGLGLMGGHEPPPKPNPLNVPVAQKLPVKALENLVDLHKILPSVQKDYAGILRAAKGDERNVGVAVGIGATQEEAEAQARQKAGQVALVMQHKLPTEDGRVVVIICYTKSWGR
jgi:hypothetical protein